MVYSGTFWGISFDHGTAERLASPGDQDKSICIRVPEVNFLNRSGLIPFSRILNTFYYFFFNFNALRSGSDSGSGYCQYIGCWSLLLAALMELCPAASVHDSCSWGSGWAPAFTLTGGNVPRPHQSQVCSPACCHVTVSVTTSVLVPVAGLERCCWLALGAQVTASVGQPGLFGVGSAGFGSERWWPLVLLHCRARMAELLNGKRLFLPLGDLC